MAGASFVESIALAAQSASNGAANSIGRVYTATSLPSQIWSFNGKFNFFMISIDFIPNIKFINNVCVYLKNSCEMSVKILKFNLKRSSYSYITQLFCIS